jgi:hypothetical protein
MSCVNVVPPIYIDSMKVYAGTFVSLILDFLLVAVPIGGGCCDPVVCEVTGAAPTPPPPPPCIPAGRIPFVTAADVVALCFFPVTLVVVPLFDDEGTVVVGGARGGCLGGASGGAFCGISTTLANSISTSSSSFVNRRYRSLMVPNCCCRNFCASINASTSSLSLNRVKCFDCEYSFSIVGASLTVCRS